ncbi:transcription initiation protein SPT3 homolog [Dreissena polymorpha]|uniref:transcription initiation protein SPT3 homolog n=1 Tax=Dreissena polymorpha TaxID=45954 RepID=UPI0022655910|nr:transcription initiation protein SPT3 homolog [Dreissena polymorpha]
MSVKEQELSPMQSGKPQHWFISDIQLMMHGMGDCNKPLHESAVLVEEITHQQIITVLHRALEVASLRGTKTLGLEDFLFLMRKDKVKLRRLLRYMHLKDKKAQLHKASSLDEEDATETDIKPATTGRRRKTCYEFLSSIDQTGELCALFEDEEEDEIKYERCYQSQRAELTSRCMDPQQYLEFSEARCTNFSEYNKGIQPPSNMSFAVARQRSLETGFSGLEAEVKPNQYALEVLSY